MLLTTSSLQSTKIDKWSSATKMAKGLSNNYVSWVCKNIFGSSFLGVFPCDIHPTSKRRKFSLIFNTGDSETPGEHFVALYLQNETLFYFDPLGEKPNDENIIKFILNQKHKRFIVWKKQIQHENSTYCGFFCIAFLLSKYKKITTFSRNFNVTNNQENNKKIVDFITAHI